MRAVKIAAAVMGVLIVIGTVVLAVMIARRPAPVAENAAVPAVSSPASTREPAGTTIVTITAAGDRLAVQLRGGGPDRVVFVDPATGTVTGRFSPQP